MSLHAFNSGCNAVGFRKNDKNYIMCCAWAQMINYDKLTMLLGEQSVTGKNIEVGDIIGVSALAVGQKNIALQIGDNHSDTTDKLNGISYTLDGSAILIDNAKNNLTCKVIDILKLPYIPGDHFIVLEVIKSKETDQEFLPLD